jgi:hypothetical protein
MMKYAALHTDHFDNAGIAFLMGFLTMTVNYIVEMVNLWNLSNITSSIVVVMGEFIALGIIADFDEYFFQIYRQTKLEYLLTDIEVIFERVNSPKRNLPDENKQTLERLMVKIKTNLKEFERIILGKNSRNGSW